MITNFKIFEELNSDILSEGDFVICQIKKESLFRPEIIDDVNNLLSSTIGILYKIYNYETMLARDWKYCIKFPKNKIPKNYLSCFYVHDDDDERMRGYTKETICVRKEEIKYWSKNIKDFDHIIDAKKYNL